MRATRVASYLGLLAWCGLLFSHAVMAEGARGLVRLLEGGEGGELANPRVQTWEITQAIAYVDRRGSVELVLGAGDSDFAGFTSAIDPGMWAYRNVRTGTVRHLTVGVRGNPSHSYAHAKIGDSGFTPASGGTVYGARIEEGRFRGRLVTIGGLRGSLFTDVTLDVPLWRVPPHKPLPSGGGAPGAALLALEAATQAEDRTALRTLMGPEMLKDFPDEQEFRQEGPKLKALFGHGHQFQKGVVLRDTAILLSSATRRGAAVSVRTLWQRIDDQWRFSSISFNQTELLQTEGTPAPFVDVEDLPLTLSDRPQLHLDGGGSMSLRHARALALASGEHLVVLSDQPLPARLPKPTSAAALRWSALTNNGKAQLVLIQLPVGGPEWDLDEVRRGTSAGPPETSLVRGKLTRIGEHLSGVFTTLRFPEGGGVETGENVVLDLIVE